MKLSKYLSLPLMLAVVAVSCKKSAFVNANINPSTLTTVDPGAQFLYGTTHFVSDFEYFYDFYQDIGPWMQYNTGGNGNSLGFNAQSGNFGYRYSNFYTNVGLALADIPHIIAKMPAAQQPARVYENAMASIAKAYYAFYVSDIDGNIPYSQAFQARYGGTLTPTYDIQQNLFDSLDLQVKNAVTTLETAQSTTQVTYAANDPFFPSNSTTDSNEVKHWKRVGNALRLKMAMRLLKRNPSGVASIVQQVLADANQMSSNADGLVLLAGPNFQLATGNLNPRNYLASKPIVDFMKQYGDPRLPIFYLPNSNGAYVGSPTDPDTCALQSYQTLYLAGTTFSSLNHRLFTPSYDYGSGAGTGTAFFPYLTYAEYCFIRAELAARGITSDNAANWYNAGVTNSIQFYSDMGAAAGIIDFTPVTAGQISGYLSTAGITYNPAKAIEQITCQAYLDFYRQPSEGWAWWKRNGFPNTTSVLAWSPLTSGGTPITINRRTALTPLPSSDANYANQQAAFTQMATDPNWGGVYSKATGRVWWDMP